MQNHPKFEKEAGFSFPADYRTNDGMTTYRVMLAVFACSVAGAVALALQIAGRA